MGRKKRIGRREGNEENRIKCRRMKREGDKEEEESRSKREEEDEIRRNCGSGRDEVKKIAKYLK